MTYQMRSFHGQQDAKAALVEPRVIKQEFKHGHLAQYVRRIFYQFRTHSHPYAQRLLSELIRHDVGGLQALDTEVDLRRPYFTDEYAPVTVVDDMTDPSSLKSAVAVLADKTPGSTLADDGLPVDDLDFDYQFGAYAVYNWEVFYHVPFTIALNLSKAGRYEDAQTWLQYIFDPSDDSDSALGPKRFWKVKPFKLDEIEHIEQTLFNLATGDDPIARDATVAAIGAWRESPLRPHLVARTRPVAYMYATVMAYIDNLIAWGDSLFRQDTRESINEGMRLYVDAANILGPRPELVPAAGSSKKQTYASLKKDLDAFGNAAVHLEADLGFDAFPPAPQSPPNPASAVLQSIGRSLYFSIPQNDKLLGYWDTVADRLFKIRNSQNLDGVFRQLPLFAPPIDPAMLARAVAAGLSISAIVAGTGASLSPVRFRFLLQKAGEITQEVKSLGAQLLAAIEKKDGETLGVLRARHEANLLGLAETVKYAQWQEAVKAREGLKVSVANAFERYSYYDRLLGTDASAIKLPDYEDFDRKQFESRTSNQDEPTIAAADPTVSIGSSFRDGNHKVSPEEAQEIDLLEAAQIVQDIANGLESTGAFLSMIPDIEAAAKPWGLGAGIEFGGTQLGAFMRGLTEVSRGVAGRISHEAQRTAKMGSYGRREQEWQQQRKAAAGEVTQLFKQLRGAEIREYIAKKEHDNQLAQIEQSKDVLEFLTNEQNKFKGDRRKTTTEDFYLWMKREAQGLHTRAFQIAYDVAKKAEAAVQREIGDASMSFIQPAYLTGKEGLFAGEKLSLDLKRLEMAYVAANLREYEITKHVSLREWFPLQLDALRRLGTCQIELPEALFDLDCPGHGFRRIKAMSLSIPCVAGPYASVNTQLTLSQSAIRRTASGYGGDWTNDTANFEQLDAVTKTIVTSTSQNDAGIFDANPNDERYLPFEGAGAISKWQVTLLGDPPSFDHDTIADVVMTIRYTARPNGNAPSAEAAAKAWLAANAARIFSVRHEFASQWAAFKAAAPAKANRDLAFTLAADSFSFRMKNVSAKAQQIHVIVAGAVSGDVALVRGNTVLATSPLIKDAHDPKSVASLAPTQAFTADGDFALRFDANTVDDVWIVVDWSSTSSPP